MDSKGRISIPAHIRDSIGIKGGDSIALVTNGKREIALLPSYGNVIIVKTVMKNLHKGMKRIIDVFNSHKMNLLSMESLTLERDEKFECIATLEPNGCDLDSLRKEIRNLNIGEVEISSYSF